MNLMMTITISVLCFYIARVHWVYSNKVRILKNRIGHYKYFRGQYEGLKRDVIEYLNKDGHDHCWQNKLDLARSVGIYIDNKKYIPETSEFLHNCIEYRKSLDLAIDDANPIHHPPKYSDYQTGDKDGHTD